MTRLRSLGVLGALALFAACDPHDGYFDEDEEFAAGGIDPYNFPPPYRGDNSIRQTAASGSFSEKGGFANGRPIGYFAFPFSPSQVVTTNYNPPSSSSWPDGQIDPLRISGPGTDFRTNVNNPVPVPLVYNFDPPGGNDPFTNETKCRAMPGYKPDPLQLVSGDQQWNVFTFPPDRFTTFGFAALPTWNYRPVVAEVSVGTGDLECQSVKSERTLLSMADDGKLNVKRAEPEADKRFGRLGLPNPDRFLAWALIDPGSAVLRVGEKLDVLQGGKSNGVTVQKYGWYGQFIVAYIDGGYIPVEDGPRVAGAPTKRMRAQRLYYPRSQVIPTGKTAAGPGGLGQGYDVLQGDRFIANAAGYSPVCEVWTYSLPATTKQEDLPKSEKEIIDLANSTLEPARQGQTASAFTPNTTIIPRYVFCLQAAPR